MAIALPSFTIGVDLGQVQDYSALCVLKRTPEGEGARYDVVGLRRFELGTPYPKVVEAVAALVANPDLRPHFDEPPDHAGGDWEHARVGDPTLLVDGTGVGRGVMSMFLDAKLPATVAPLVITGGLGWRMDEWDETGTGTRAYWVAKAELVGAVQAGLQSGTLKVVAGLAEAETLRRELSNFRVRVSKAANELYSSREGTHDDLVLALAMALWHASMPTPTGGWGPNLSYLRA